ncbi:MAG: MBL fold metallo-hydrolase [Candidatus Omnitrophica bacterium]|nr:MBL fold metallo-hydrolase [Candidatus Omnitrophota bacterium]
MALPKSLIDKSLILKQIEIGPMGNFTYFIGDALSNEIAVVDPGWQAEQISELAKEEGFKIKAVLLTHGHFDHVQATGDLLKWHNVPVYISKKDIVKILGAEIKFINDSDKIKIGSIELECIHTPGHTPGGMCFRYKNVLLTGDTLFINAIGRCDLPGSDEIAMEHSLEKICKLPDDTLIFSGHGYGPKDWDTLGNQRKTNPYLQNL